MKNMLVSLLMILVVLSGCSVDNPQGFVRTEGTRFVDAYGREMLFHGVNVVNKEPRKNYTEIFDSLEIQALASYGFNVIRLGVIWSGVEPEPGLYDDHYLEEIDQMIRWINQAGMYVLLDMHQDLFGQKFSDGAPDWATLDQGLPHFKGAIWSDSYMISPAVQAAFDNFWDNAQASDGTGVQDRYVNMWKMLAKRYQWNAGIIGFDLMNEPFMGTEAQQVMPLMIQAYAHQMMDLETDWKSGALQENMAALADKWADERGRLEILRTLDDASLYGPVIQSAAGICQQFEKNKLNPFYQRLRDTIRSVNQNHILFLEHNYFSNTGIPSAISIPLDETGKPDALIAYAAHGYDLVTDTREVGLPSYGRVDYIFHQIHETSERLDVPLFVGEWGAYGGDHPVYAETAGAVMSLFEKFTCSHTYWAYSDIDFNQKSYFPVLNRSFPVLISGELNTYTWDASTRSSYMEYTVTGLEKHASWIYFPDEDLFNPASLTFTPEVRYKQQEHPSGQGLFLIINPPNIAGKVKISYFEPSND